jgi:CO dehydrogenase/acetyl-CoA synthase epsilon subunit
MAAKRKPFHVLLPECPAAEICRAKKAVCSVCEELTEEEWREHVRKVLNRV